MIDPFMNNVETGLPLLICQWSVCEEWINDTWIVISRYLILLVKYDTDMHITESD